MEKVSDEPVEAKSGADAAKDAAKDITAAVEKADPAATEVILYLCIYL